MDITELSKELIEQIRNGASESDVIQLLTDNAQALQLLQPDVSGSNCCKQCKKEIDTPFRFCSPECKQYYYR